MTTQYEQNIIPEFTLYRWYWSTATSALLKSKIFPANNITVFKVNTENPNYMIAFFAPLCILYILIHKLYLIVLWKYPICFVPYFLLLQLLRTEVSNSSEQDVRMNVKEKTKHLCMASHLERWRSCSEDETTGEVSPTNSITGCNEAEDETECCRRCHR